MKLFRDEERLSPEFVPSTLPHREKELSLLRSFFSSLLSGSSPYSVRAVITGSVGTGKTSLAKLFGQQFERDARKAKRNVVYVHVNCRINRTLFSVLRRIVEVAQLPLPRRGFTEEEVMHRLLEHLTENDAHLILTADEAEALLMEEGAEPFYFLSRIGEETDEPRLSVIVILRDIEILERLDSQTRSSLLGTAVHLSVYGYSELLDIVRFRAAEAFIPTTVPEETLEFLADVSAERGDARYAIDLLWRSGKFAEAEGSSRVTAEHVRKAMASVYPAITRGALGYLSHDETVALLACARSMRGDKAYVTSAELFEAYRLICEERSWAPKGYTSFWETLQTLQDQGFIRIKVQSEGARGRRSYISLPGIPSVLLEAELMRVLDSPRA